MATVWYRFGFYLDAVLEQIAWSREALFLIQWLTEDDDLLEEEDTPLLGPGQEAGVLIRHQERVLEEEPALSYNFALKTHRGKKKTQNDTQITFCTQYISYNTHTYHVCNIGLNRGPGICVPNLVVPGFLSLTLIQSRILRKVSFD